MAFSIKVMWVQAHVREGYTCSHMGLEVPTWQWNVDDLRHTNPTVANPPEVLDLKQGCYNIGQSYLTREKQ
jgi:hypothetical protein